VTSKICKGCGAEKDLAEFYKHPRRADGHLNKCKVCVKSRVRDNRRERLEQYAQDEKSRANLPHRVQPRQGYREEHTGQISAYTKRWATENEDSVSASRRRHYECNCDEVIVRSKKWAEDNSEKGRLAKANHRRKREPRNTPARAVLPPMSSQRSASVTVTDVWPAVTPKPHWRLTMSRL
jgi:hypothetical protein